MQSAILDDTSLLLATLPLWAQTLIYLALLLATAVIANWLIKKVFLKIAEQQLERVSLLLASRHVDPIVGRLTNIVPAVIIARGTAMIPGLPAGLVTVVGNVSSAFIVLTIALAIGAMLDASNKLYQRRPDASQRPIKGYIQVAKILVYGGGAILILAALMEQSPLLLLSGLGAMAAVLMLVFKDTILSLVASVQLTSNDMLRVGDWIEMPQLNADGDVIDIALHTVKVQNWDKTITTIPTYRLISESYRNWRGMSESGGRRIKRALYLDQTSVRFLSNDEKARLRRFASLGPYMDAKQAEIDAWNETLHETGLDPVNQRAMTNVGTFRAYVMAYLEAHPRIHQEMTLLVRQMQPTAEGLPIELYCFTSTTAWAEYEAIQGDLFDHLIAILPHFDLRLFQAPTGTDMRQMLQARGDNPDTSSTARPA